LSFPDRWGFSSSVGDIKMMHVDLICGIFTVPQLAAIRNLRGSQARFSFYQVVKYIGEVRTAGNLSVVVAYS
jgi:hypothetical protein